MKGITIRAYVKQSGRNITGLCKRIGISRPTLYAWMDQGARVVELDKLGNIKKITLNKILYEEQVEK